MSEEISRQADGMDGKVAIVTGGAGGIGRAIAATLAAEGARVAIADVDEAGGASLVAEVTASGGDAVFVPTDAGDVQSIRAMVASTIERFGRGDLLANNVGVTKRQGIFEVTEEDWDFQHSINAKGAFFCLQAVAEQMAEAGGGRIVNVASIAALGFRDTTSIAYSASKGAVLTMTKVAAHLLAPSGITVNAVCPGPTNTEFVARQRSAELGRDLDEAKRERLFASMDAYVPLGRANTAQDVAEVVIFLLSDKGRNVTGSTYVVDGGIMLY